MDPLFLQDGASRRAAAKTSGRQEAALIDFTSPEGCIIIVGQISDVLEMEYIYGSVSGALFDHRRE